MSDQEPLSEHALVVRSVTVSELMNTDGEMWVTVTTTGEPSCWQQLGLVEAAGESIRLATRTMWTEAEEDDGD